MASTWPSVCGPGRSARIPAARFRGHGPAPGPGSAALLPQARSSLAPVLVSTIPGRPGRAGPFNGRCPGRASAGTLVWTPHARERVVAAAAQETLVLPADCCRPDSGARAGQHTRPFTATSTPTARRARPAPPSRSRACSASFKAPETPGVTGAPPEVRRSPRPRMRPAEGARLAAASASAARAPPCSVPVALRKSPAAALVGPEPSPGGLRPGTPSAGRAHGRARGGTLAAARAASSSVTCPQFINRLGRAPVQHAARACDAHWSKSTHSRWM